MDIDNTHIGWDNHIVAEERMIEEESDWLFTKTEEYEKLVSALTFLFTFMIFL